MSIKRVSELPILDGTNVTISAFNDSFLEISYQESPEEPKKYLSRAMRGSALRDILSATIQAGGQALFKDNLSAMDGLTVRGGMNLSGDVLVNQGDPQYTKYKCQARFGTVEVEGRNGIELTSLGAGASIGDGVVALAPAATVEQTVATEAKSVVNVAFLTQRLQELYDQITAMIPDVPEQTVYYLDAETEDSSKGVVTGGGSNTTGIFTIVATPNSGYAFSKWRVGGSCTVLDAQDSSTIATSTAKVAGWATATAEFKSEDPGLPNLTEVNSACVSALAEGTYLYFKNAESTPYYYPVTHRSTSISYHTPTVKFSDGTSVKYSKSSEMKADGLTYSPAKSDSRLMYLSSPITLGSKTYKTGYLYTLTVSADGSKYNGSAALKYVQLVAESTPSKSWVTKWYSTNMEDCTNAYAVITGQPWIWHGSDWRILYVGGWYYLQHNE